VVSASFAEVASPTSSAVVATGRVVAGGEGLLVVAVLERGADVASSPEGDVFDGGTTVVAGFDAAASFVSAAVVEVDGST
jgi:hypothetical protein